MCIDRGVVEGKLLTEDDVKSLLSCGGNVFVVDRKVYQLPSTFLHPGGAKVLELHRGKDISMVFRGIDGHHAHSLAAHKLLEKYQIGVLPDLQAESINYDRHSEALETRNSDCLQQTVDPSRPLAFQVGLLGEHYRQWVHQPEHGTARFFECEVFESLTKTPWWVVPLLWGPIVAGGLWISMRKYNCSSWMILVMVLFGLLMWQLVEYCIHRFVFHREPHSYWGVTIHFLLHGCHHKYPMDELRLVFPPLPASVMASIIYGGLHGTLPQVLALPMFCGVILGYIAYDCLHYAMHHGTPVGAWFMQLKGKHMEHHFREPSYGFGITSNVFDTLFGTMGPHKHIKAQH